MSEIVALCHKLTVFSLLLIEGFLDKGYDTNYPIDMLSIWYFN